MSDMTNVHQGTAPGVRRLPFGRRGLVLLAMALIGVGMATNWGWLTAVGAAPLILSLAPCAAMCGLGLCMTGESKACNDETGAMPAPVDRND